MSSTSGHLFEVFTTPRAGDASPRCIRRQQRRQQDRPDPGTTTQAAVSPAIKFLGMLCPQIFHELGEPMSVTVERPNELDRMRFFINGEWAEPSAVRIQQQVEAATGEVIGLAALGSETDIDAAVKAARGALDNGPWGRTTAGERAAMLRKFA